MLTTGQKWSNGFKHSITHFRLNGKGLFYFLLIDFNNISWINSKMLYVVTNFKISPLILNTHFLESDLFICPKIVVFWKPNYIFLYCENRTSEMVRRQFGFLKLYCTSAAHILLKNLTFISPLPAYGGGGLLVCSLSVCLSVCQSVCPSHFHFPDFSLPSFEILTWNLVYEFVMT